MLRCLLIGEFTSQWSMHVNGETKTLQVHEMRVKNRQSKDNNYVYNRSWPCESLSFSQFSCSVMSNALQPHELQQTRPPCPSPTPRVHPNSHPSSR